MSNKILIVVDMQNDFIDGSLGSEEAKAIVPKVVEKIKGWDGEIAYTMDTHDVNYLSTTEGINLPVEHCIKQTVGWYICGDILSAMTDMIAGSRSNMPMMITKNTFGSVELGSAIRNNQYEYVEIVGLCTDICVISNALLIKAFSPETEIIVDASCCAGVTPQSHKNALEAMKMCQIKVIGE